jgi:S-(hydroxymethyl)glutathione dehydrogenase/alcohol dehydrogenase
MRAAVLREVPGWLEVSAIELDGPGPNEIVIRTAASGICHSDLHCLEGSFPVRLPVILGHEGSGVVEAVGDGVNAFKMGDHVVTCLSAACGHCHYCVSGRPYLCPATAAHARRARLLSDSTGQRLSQFMGLGTFAEMTIVHERAAVVIPPDMPLDRAALLGCAVTTGVGAVINTAAVTPGSSVAVIGCGGVGLNCIQGAALADAGRIVAIDLDPVKLERATAFGATDTVCSSKAVVEEVVELTGGGVEFSFEVVGRPELVRQAFSMLRPGGTATAVGVAPTGATVEVPLDRMVMEGKRLQGSVMGSNHFRVEIPRYVELHLQGRLKLEELISSRITLDQANDGMRDLHQGVGARSVIVF